MICKRAWFLKLIRSQKALNETYPSLSYYESKHPLQDSGRQHYIEVYQLEKSQYRGNNDPDAKILLFFDQIQKDPEHDCVAAGSSSGAPLAAWLVTPRRWTDFTVEG